MVKNENGGKLGEVEALVKAQQYKYYIYHMYRKLSKIRTHIDVYNVIRVGL